MHNAHIGLRHIVTIPTLYFFICIDSVYIGVPILENKLLTDYWKPDDLPIEEASDSSENSSSLVTNLSIEKMPTLDKDVETSDSSEDEYIPIGMLYLILSTQFNLIRYVMLFTKAI